ncbi:MAG: SufE family protein [Pseudomonadaceae bacterium]|nr:SufE family protein [Pseudomonadaceae bacterium]
MDVAELRETFTFFDDWEDKYRFVIDLGKELEDIPEGDKVEKNLIRGCQSQVWLTHTVTDDGTIHFKLDSDAFIVRGLISIVLTALNNKRPEDVLAFDIYALFEELELLQHLSQTRGNGLRAMIARIREIAEDLA